MIRPRAVLPSLLLLASCVSSGAPSGGTDFRMSAETQADEERRKRLADTLVKLDQQVDRYVMLGSQSGDDLRNEREMLAGALAAQVAQYKADLLAIAADPDKPERRRTAVKALAFSKDPAAVPVLVAALDVREDPRLVTNATYALGRIHAASTPVEPLLALVRDGDRDMRSNSLMALWHIFDERHEAGLPPLDARQAKVAMPLLEAALFEPSDPLIRAHAAAALGAIGDTRSVDPLLNLLRDPQPLVRTQTALALGKLGDTKAIPGLIAVIEETAAGTPRSAVLLGLTLILEKAGHRVPDSLGENPAAWEDFAKEALDTTLK